MEVYVTGDAPQPWQLWKLYSWHRYRMTYWYFFKKVRLCCCACDCIFLKSYSSFFLRQDSAGRYHIFPNLSPVVWHPISDDLTLPQPQCMMGERAAVCVSVEAKSLLRRPHDSSRLTLFRMKVRLAACHDFTNTWRAKKRGKRKRVQRKKRETSHN